MKVSVIMATYNRGHFIGKALKSILDQSYDNWECIIIDDGSEDETNDIVKDWEGKDPRFKYFIRNQKYRKGLSGARNMGLDLASGDLILFVDDDDFVHPNNLEFCSNILQNPNFSFCRYNKKPVNVETETLNFSSVNLKEPEIEIINIESVADIIKGDLAFASCCVMWKKECFEKHHLRFKESLQYAEEWELYIRIILKGYKGVSTDEILYFNRKHLASNTGEFQKKHPIRISSKIQASKFIIQNLSKKMMTNDLNQFFLRLGFSLKSWDIIKMTLQKSDSGKFKLIKYRLGYIFYPLLKPIFIIKRHF